MGFSESLKYIRQEKQMSQKKLADLVGVSQTAVYQWENGNRCPKIEQIRQLAAALDVSIGDLQADWTSFSKEDIENDLKNKTSLKELRLIQNYRILNEKGQKKVLNYTEDLTKIPEYRKEEE